MWTDAGYAKILDFGLVKLRLDPSVNTLTSEAITNVASGAGVLLGTVGYMSPEQAQGRPVDARSDIFSFGCVLYETVTGSRAFSGTSAIDTLHKIVVEDPVSLSAAAPASPAELQRIVRKCLAKDPLERYQSIREVAIDLRDLRRQLDSVSTLSAAPAVKSSGA